MNKTEMTRRFWAKRTPRYSWSPLDWNWPVILGVVAPACLGGLVIARIVVELFR